MTDQKDFAYSDIFHLDVPPPRVVQILDSCIVLLGLPLSYAAREEISTQMYEIFKTHKTKSSWVMQWLEHKRAERLVEDVLMQDSGPTPTIFFKPFKSALPVFGLPFTWETKSPLESGVHQRKE